MIVLPKRKREHFSAHHMLGYESPYVVIDCFYKKLRTHEKYLFFIPLEIEDSGWGTRVEYIYMVRQLSSHNFIGAIPCGKIRDMLNSTKPKFVGILSDVDGLDQHIGIAASIFFSDIL